MNQILSIGLVRQQGVFTELTREMLDHQGISYDELDEQSQLSSKYPIVLMANFSTESYELARKSCLSEDNVIIVEKIINLDRILKCLSGLDDTMTNKLDLVVNEEETKLRDAIQNSLRNFNLPLVVKWFWPGTSKACCVVTSDVDWFTYSPFHRAVLDGQLGALKIFKLLVEALVLRRDYGWNIPEIIELQKKYGAKSSFYFQTDYGKNSGHFKESVKLLLAENFEIGLHASHSSHESLEALKAELRAFEKSSGGFPAGIRYHILKFKVPDTWRLESEVGIEYDATFYYNRYFGFRAEVCFPFHPFGVERMKITELPTAFMDWTALHMKKRGRDAEEVLKRIRDKVEKYNGVLTVNFHNTYINKETFPDIYRLHEELLKYARSNGYWIATSRECVTWWNDRAGTQLKPRMIDSKTVEVNESRVSSFIYGEKSNFAIVNP